MPFEIKSDAILTGFISKNSLSIEEIVEDAIHNAHLHADEFLWMRFIYHDQACESLRALFRPLMHLFRQKQELPSRRHYFVLGNYFQFVALRYEDAFHCYEKALPDVGALNNLGYMHLDGIHVKKSLQKAKEFFLKAIEAGSIISLVNLAVCCFDENKIPEGLSYLEKAIIADSPHAFAVLGGDHFSGKIKDGYNQSYHNIEAIKYYKCAAERGSISALEVLAKVYSEGCAIYKQDLDRAAQYYEVVYSNITNKIDRDSIFISLGVIYKDFLKLNDYIPAEQFFLKNFQNTPIAALVLAKMYAAGGKGVEKNIEKAAELFHLSLQRGQELESTGETLLVLFGQFSDNPVIVFYYVVGTLQPSAHKDPGHMLFNKMALEKKHAHAFTELFEKNPRTLDYLSDKNYKKVSQKINEKVVKRYQLIQNKVKASPAKIVNDYLMGDRSFCYLVKPFFLPPRTRPGKEASNPNSLFKFIRRFKT